MNRPSPARVQVRGPLGAYAGSFREELSRLGYSSSSAAGHLQLMAHLSRWLADTGLGPSELTVSCAERFAGHRRAVSRVHRCLTLHGMGPLLDHLRRIGVVPAPERVNVVGGRAQLIEEFVGYLIARWQGEDLVGVSAEAVNVFVLSEAARRPATVLTAFTVAAARQLPLAILDSSVEACLPTFRAKAADRAHVAYMPDTAWPATRTPARLIPG